MKNWTSSQKIARFFATGFYSGLSPIIPGTVGSVAAFLIAFFLLPLFSADYHLPLVLGLALGSFAIGVPCCNYLLASAHYEEDEKDPGEFVIDEFAGFFVTIVGLPYGVWNLLLALICFRIFDILKPPPVSTLEKFPQGWGIMLDDVAAGVYGAMLCWAVLSMW